jgi:hypothetical protein
MSADVSSLPSPIRGLCAAIRAIWNPNGGVMPAQFGPASPSVAIAADPAVRGRAARGGGAAPPGV